MRSQLNFSNFWIIIKFFQSPGPGIPLPIVTIQKNPIKAARDFPVGFVCWINRFLLYCVSTFLSWRMKLFLYSDLAPLEFPTTWKIDNPYNKISVRVDRTPNAWPSFRMTYFVTYVLGLDNSSFSLFCCSMKTGQGSMKASTITIPLLKESLFGFG